MGNNSSHIERHASSQLKGKQSTRPSDQLPPIQHSGTHSRRRIMPVDGPAIPAGAQPFQPQLAAGRRFLQPAGAQPFQPASAQLAAGRRFLQPVGAQPFQSASVQLVGIQPFQPASTQLQRRMIYAVNPPPPAIPTGGSLPPVIPAVDQQQRPVTPVCKPLLNISTLDQLNFTNYLRINGTDWRNIYVVGDLHGSFSLLKEHLKKNRFDFRKDLLISVGDLIDRGYENVECLRLVTQPWFKAVRGNHEQMMLDATLGHNEHERLNWFNKNGGKWIQSIPTSQKEMVLKCLLNPVAALPFVIEVETQGQTWVICHADYPSNNYEYGKSVSAIDTIWSRERIKASLRGNTCKISGADQFIFGHTIVKQTQHFSNQYYIDTGAYSTSAMTVKQIQCQENL